MTTVIDEPIDVWWIDLDSLATQRGRDLGTYLAKDERARACRLRTVGGKRRYTAGREMLRMALAHRAGLDPAEVAFEYGARGKPSTDTGDFFSVAHSDGLCVVAITHLGTIGVDIERMRASVDVDRLAPRVFRPEEVRRLAALRDGDRLRAFFEKWVRTEAMAKALGIGLLPFWSSASLAARRPIDLGSDRDSGYAIAPFSPAPDFTGCVAVRGCHHATVRLRSLTELG